MEHGLDLALHRSRPEEQERIRNLLSLLPTTTKSVLDAGARDGYISLQLANNALAVTALDLVQPKIDHANVLSIKGDITRLEFPDKHFDTVLCAEVLEHIPPDSLAAACSELKRVSKRHVLIGVPYKQDIRVSRTTCMSCGRTNPPWSHVNSFCEQSLSKLFPQMKMETISFVGTTRNTTNALSAMLLDMAGNPFGTYEQDEPCIHCGAKLTRPPNRTLLQRLYTRIATRLTQAQQLMKRPQPNWIHILFTRADT